MAALDLAGIRYVRAYNESSAVLMAAGEAQASGGYGVAIVSMSAGMSNAVNGLTHALMEQVPLLVISGEQPAARRPFIIRQGFEVASLARSVTKWQVQVSPGMDVGQLLAKALYIASERPKGPVYVELPAEVGRGQASTDPRWAARVRTQASAVPHARPPGLTETEIRELRDAASSAKRPLIIVGGRQHLDLAGPLDKLSRSLRAPVLVTPNQKGCVAPLAEYSAGVFLNSNPDRHLLERSDLVLAVNLEAFDIYSGPLNVDAQIISLSSAPIAETFIPFAAEYVADPVDSIARLVASGRPGASEWTAGDVRHYREQLAADLTKLDHVPGALTTSDVVGVLGERVPADANVVADAGFAKPIVVHLWPSTRPGSFFASNAFGTMGHALPTAIALKLADPSRPTLALMGDGSLLMRAGELQAAADAGASLVAVVFLDRSFTQIAVKQQRRGLAPVGVDLPKLSAASVGAAFGWHGADVQTDAELSDAVAAALQRNQPTLIGAHIDNTNASEVFGYLRG
jgi:acetolactate synthase-1/2/3 large subunit